MSSYQRIYDLLVLKESQKDWSQENEEGSEMEKIHSKKRGGKRPEPPFWGKERTAKSIKKRIKRNLRRLLGREENKDG